tara:strand:+ start:569 stop:1108 length:540 start_codon:yes stop_codon:yes gene_type:complete
MECSDIENDDVIDNNWINELENEEAKYNEFYKIQQTQITCYILFIDNLNTISKITKDNLHIINNKIDSCEIAICFEKNRIKSYMLSNVLVFNVDVTIDDILSNSINTQYLTSHSPFSDIYIHPTISMFHTVNTVFIFAKEQNKNKNTRRVFIKTTNKKTTNKKTKNTHNIVSKKQQFIC